MKSFGRDSFRDPDLSRAGSAALNVGRYVRRDEDNSPRENLEIGELELLSRSFVNRDGADFGSSSRAFEVGVNFTKETVRKPPFFSASHGLLLLSCFLAASIMVEWFPAGEPLPIGDFADVAAANNKQ